MGSETRAQSYTREERQRYREKVRQDLDVFERMLATSQFEFDRPMTGLEIELNLVDEDYQPQLRQRRGPRGDRRSGLPDRARAIQHRAQRHAPAAAGGRRPSTSRRTCATSLNVAEQRARAPRRRGSSRSGSSPRSCPEHFTGEWISDNNRYTALNDSIFVARGEDIHLDIEGPTGERLSTYSDSIAPESACTSVQLHLQVAPQDFAAHWNAAQALSAPQIALAANSPFFFGRRLHAETRIELFAQATDTRPVELKNQGVRPRVFFGERWITSIFDLFEENVRYFPALLAEVSDEDPVAKLEAGEAPDLTELRLHNGTVYRWNRPDLRPRRRDPAPARREPGPPGRPDDRRRPRQRGLLLRRRPHARRARTARSGRR